MSSASYIRAWLAVVSPHTTFSHLPYDTTIISDSNQISIPVQSACLRHNTFLPKRILCTHEDPLRTVFQNRGRRRQASPHFIEASSMCYTAVVLRRTNPEWHLLSALPGVFLSKSMKMRRKYSKVVLGFVCIHLTGTFCCVMRRHHRDIKASTIFAILQLISLCYILIPHDMSTTAVKKNDLILITGGFGFIGSHVAQILHSKGHRVRIADIVTHSSFSEPICSEAFQGNLCDIEFCKLAVKGVDVVLHFAANMGGMGTIHAANDFEIYSGNHMMTVNLLQTSVSAGVRKLLYASSACVYPDALQGSDQQDVSLKEQDVWAMSPPHPQGLYGLEKLHSELVLEQYSGRIQTHVARFHNVYGPRGSWKNGREKAPAAMLRKAFAAKELPASLRRFEIWGSGQQRRSFLFIDDCVKGIIALLNSECSTPVNIGSNRAVSIQELAEIALRCAGIQSYDIMFEYKDGPVGVGSRNSNNEFASGVLAWEPETSLEEGMRQTGQWIKEELAFLSAGLDQDCRVALLQSLGKSNIVQFSSEVVRFAILLPITSRGAAGPESCLEHLAIFAQSLRRTTWRNTHELGGTRYRVTVYVSIDDEDEFLLERNKPEKVLQSNGIAEVVTLTARHPKGAVCSHWRDCARRAWEDGCDYFTLLGDDVVLQDEGWMEDVHAEYTRITKFEKVPQGFGCVAFTDTSFLGMPTFPVVHKTHLNIFAGQVVPEIFLNQDGDPFLFQLYRRWGCSSMISSRISNSLGGSGDARYEKQHAQGWTFDTLDNATSTVEVWLSESAPAVQKKLTLDVVIPCYRVKIPYLDVMLNLKSSPTCNVMFIIIIDDPNSSSIQPLEKKYSHRPDVRIRINKENLGASASRNRGMAESSAEWIHFLDDDVSPEPNLLVEAEKVIREHPNAAGFVGNCKFPPADNIFTAAVRLAGVTYFWDIAEKMQEDMPWGVTANLIARRNVMDGVEFDLRFPKTGGGEDIDFCRRKRNFSVDNGGEGFWAAPTVLITHPWWFDGRRSYWRFYRWAKGDGALAAKYPQFRYWDAAPNSGEILFGSMIILAIGLLYLLFSRERGDRVLIFGGKAVVAVFLTNFVHDVYRHLWRDVDRVYSMNTSVSGMRWLIAILESSLIRMASETGRTVGMAERGELMLLGKRFDWFTQRAGLGPRQEERKDALEKMALLIVLLSVF